MIPATADQYKRFTQGVYPRSEQIQGWLRRREALSLYLLASGLPVGSTIVEIGSHMGKSTYLLASGIQGQGTVYAIDPWDVTGTEDGDKWYGASDRFASFSRNVYGLPVIPLRGLSQNVEWLFADEEIDMLFIDGDHRLEGVTLDFDLFSRKLKVGGTLAMHDVYLPGQIIDIPNGQPIALPDGFEYGPGQLALKRIYNNPRWSPPVLVETLLLTAKLQEGRD